MHLNMSISGIISKLLIIVIILLLCFSSKIDATCHANEKQALIEFKKELKDPSGRLLSWIDHHIDCCRWEGVVCSNKSDNVIQLRLQNLGRIVMLGSPYYTLGEAIYEVDLESALSGKISPSLLNLTRLHYLDLSLNDFKGICIPNFIGSLKSLRYLNLSQAGFQGRVPHQLGNLSNLHTLSIGRNKEIVSPYRLQVDNLQWLAGLSNLEHLNMNDVDLSMASNWLEVINMIPSLVEFHLSSCELIQISQIIHVNFSSLTILDLSENLFGTLLPSWVFGLNALVSLDLSDDGFETPWPRGPWNLTSLNHLDLSWNRLNSSFPDGIRNLSCLKSLDLSYNKFNGFLQNILPTLSGLISLDLRFNSLQGLIPNTIVNISNLQYLDLSSNHLNSSLPNSLFTLDDLIVLDINYNQFSGPIPSTVGNSIKLRYLDLGHNTLSGSIPSNIERLSSLEFLDISGNKLTGTLPESFGHHSKLQLLNISDNLMEGIVTESMLDNLTNLRYFYASINSLTLKVSGSWIPRVQYEELYLGSWNLGPKFPTWLQSQKHIKYLDLSFTGISDTIPSWFWNLSTQPMYGFRLSHNQLHGEILNISITIGGLDLSSNRFSGPLPQLNSQTLWWLNLSNNLFSGGISRFLCDAKNEDRNLQYLHLGDNLLSGEIPDCWMNWPNLWTINLNNNNFTGSIPRSILNLKYLGELRLSNSSLSGPISLTL